MAEHAWADVFLATVPDAFAFLGDEFGFVLVGSQRWGPFHAAVTWQTTDARTVRVNTGQGTEVSISRQAQEVTLEVILEVTGIRRALPAPLPPSDPYGVQRLARTTRRYAAPWLRGEPGAFDAAREYMEVVGAWDMERATQQYPRSYRQYRQLKREWERYDYEKFMHILEGMPRPWTAAEQAMYAYAKQKVSDGHEEKL